MRLLERERELAEAERALDVAAGGAGGAIVVEGPPGVGKSVLLDAICERGRERRFHVLRARAGEFEGGLAFGVVRELFAHVARSLAPAERARWVASAGAARPLFDRAAVGSDRQADPAVVLHALYWLVLDLAEEAPVLVAVDDAHWADAQSSGFLLYLARRIADAGVVVAVTGRRGEEGPHRELDAVVPVVRLAPEPLGTEAAAALVRATLPDAEDPFCDACRAAAAGNPFILVQLVAEVAAADVAPSAANAEAVAGLVPAGIAKLAVDRVRRCDETAVAVAEAVAALGPDAYEDVVAAVTELAPEEVRRAVSALVGMHVLEDAVPLAFVHPLVRAAFYGNLGAIGQARLHARAWRIVAERTEGLARAATHLLAAPPEGEREVVEILLTVADRALAEGAPGAAAAALSRALEEPPPPELRTRVRWQLGRARFGTGAPEAADDLMAAHAELSGEEAAHAALDASRALFHLGRFAESVVVADEAASDPQLHAEIGLRLRVQALAAAAWIGDGVADRVRQGLAVEMPAGSLGRSLFADQVAEAGWFSGMRADDHARVAASALEDERILAEGAGLHSLWVLIMSDHHEAAARHASRMLAGAQASGSELAFATVSGFAAMAAERRGDVREAEALAMAGFEVARRQAPQSIPFVFALTALIWALTARGALDEASALEAEHPVLDDLPTSMLSESLRFALARLWVARGDLERGADSLIEVHRGVAAMGITNPAPWNTRNFAVPALLQLGDRDRALALAQEELALARDYGAPGTIGGALRSLGMATGGDEGIALLEESVRVLEGSGMRLYLARSLCELGSALRRRRARGTAREPLERAMGLAHECGADGLAEHARTELVAAGARPRRLALRGVAALTASERRVADLAADGRTNREIANALFVTPKTVEKHLRNAYDKLGIASREGLAEAMRAGEE